MNLFSHTILFFIEGLRPLLGPSNCRYPVGCTAFAREQFEKESFFKALKNTTLRVLSCNPFTK